MLWRRRRLRSRRTKPASAAQPPTKAERKGNTMAVDKLLSIYLNDHLAGSTIGVRLARRISAKNRGTPLGGYLERLTSEIESDRETLERLMDELGIRRNRLKAFGAWATEKLGRLKLNGQLTGYSPLSRFVELEALYLGITGKRELWRALQRTLGNDEQASTSRSWVAGQKARPRRSKSTGSRPLGWPYCSRQDNRTQFSTQCAALSADPQTKGNKCLSWEFS